MELRTLEIIAQVAYKALMDKSPDGMVNFAQVKAHTQSLMKVVEEIQGTGVMAAPKPVQRAYQSSSPRGTKVVGEGSMYELPSGQI